MRKLGCAVLVTGAALGLGASAVADSTTLKGTGDIVKMSVNNARTTLTVKVYGLAAPCEAHSLSIVVRWGTRATYQATGGCYTNPTTSDPEWLTDLTYGARGPTTGGTDVKCPGFRLTYIPAAGAYRAVIPRTCLSHAADAVAVSADGSVYSSARGGEVGPTRRLGRG